MPKFDFAGWATRNGCKCSDGRVIIKDAFAHDDGESVPLVWNHQHGGIENVLGHAMLENQPDGVMAYCSFNDSENGQMAKQAVMHGDITSLSIFATHLKEEGKRVMHGAIKEVSLVLAGANPKAKIVNILSHDESIGVCAEIYFDEELSLEHGEIDIKKKAKEDDPDEDKPTLKKEDQKAQKTKKTVGEVLDSMTEEQQAAVDMLLEEAIASGNKSEESDDSTDIDDDSDSKKNKKTSEGGKQNMKHNAFDAKDDKDNGVTLSHSAVEAIFSDGVTMGSLKRSVLAHAATYGIENIGELFPDAKAVNDSPEFISRRMEWVESVMSKTHHTPFSRIKTIFADITADEARAKGYLKGNLKKDEVFSLLKRATSPCTIYKKQKIDRDDQVDITDFGVVAWLRSEMRIMLDEEIARAILVGDGRLASSEDKIDENCIRPIWKDAELYAIQAVLDVDSAAVERDRAKSFIRTVIKARKEYRGSGQTVLYANEDTITECLLLEDKNERVIYDTIEKLATALRVKEIIPVPAMEGLTRVKADTKTYALNGIIVDLLDYNTGADKGGEVNVFDDFDIDYNQQKYLIETRCSGALIKPKSAIIIETVQAVVAG